MKRPALDYAALPDVPVSQMTPAEQLIAKVAWISDNAAYGTLEAAKLLIDDIRAGSFTGATPRPSARPEAARITIGPEDVDTYSGMTVIVSPRVLRALKAAVSPLGTPTGCQHRWIYVANPTGQPYWQCDKCLEATNTDPLPSLLPQKTP